jgi:hypothetical protein
LTNQLDKGPDAEANTSPNISPLTLGDVQITRDAGNTQSFLVSLCFRPLKEHIHKASSRGNVLKQMIKSPADIQHLPLSLPRRLVVLALHRGLFVNHTSARSVLHGNDFILQLKPECKDQLVVTFDGYNNSEVVNRYLRQACQNAGFSLSDTYYSSRRQFGTTGRRTLGVEIARKAMAHEIGSSAYWQYYDCGLDHVDVTDLVVDGDDGRAAGGITELSFHLLRATDKAAFERDLIAPWTACACQQHVILHSGCRSSAFTCHKYTSSHVLLCL